MILEENVNLMCIWFDLRLKWS